MVSAAFSATTALAAVAATESVAAGVLIQQYYIAHWQGVEAQQIGIGLDMQIAQANAAAAMARSKEEILQDLANAYKGQREAQGRFGNPGTLPPILNPEQWRQKQEAFQEKLEEWADYIEGLYDELTAHPDYNPGGSAPPSGGPPPA